MTQKKKQQKNKGEKKGAKQNEKKTNKHYKETFICIVNHNKNIQKLQDKIIILRKQQN